MKDAIPTQERNFKADIERLEGEAAWSAAGNLSYKLEDAYPEREYMEISPGANATGIIGYVSKVGPETVGVIVGKKGLASDKVFHATFFLVDPQYQNSNISRDLMQAVAADFDEVYILPFAHGQRISQDEQYGSRVRALVIYYGKLGFKAMPGQPYPPVMVWKKPNNNETV